VTGPAFEGGLYAAWHEPELELAVVSVHVAGVNVPPAPPSLQVRVPVGVVGDMPSSVTVAVNVAEVPMVADAGSGVTAVDVGSDDEVTERGSHWLVTALLFESPL
jgi:hypothetical protein